MVYIPKGFTTDPYFNAIGSRAPDFRAWGVVYLKRPERRGLRKRVLYKQYARRGRFTLSDYRRKKNLVLIFFPYNQVDRKNASVAPKRKKNATGKNICSNSTLST